MTRGCARCTGAVDRQEEPSGQRRRPSRSDIARMDPEPPRLVARGRDDASSPGRPADDDRPAAQLRAVALLDGREERVEVDVEDRPVGHARYHRPAVEAPADGSRAAVTRARRRGWSASPSPSSSRAAPVALVWPVLFAMPGLGRRPARRPRPAGARRGRCRHRGQRLPVGPPRRSGGPRRRFRPAGRCWLGDASWSSLARPCSRGSATRGWRRCQPDAAGIRSSLPRCGRRALAARVRRARRVRPVRQRLGTSRR